MESHAGRWILAPPLVGAIPDTEAQLDRTDDGHGNGSNDDGCQPGRTGGEQSESELKEHFHIFVVHQVREFGQIAARKESEALTSIQEIEKFAIAEYLPASFFRAVPAIEAIMGQLFLLFYM
jgi:hypothetical protein